MGKLGWRQRHMLDFMHKYPGLHHISRHWRDRRVATSLEARGLIYVDRAYECWIVWLKP